MVTTSYVIDRTVSSENHSNDCSLHNSLASVVSALESLPSWAGVLATNLSDGRVFFRKPPPFALEEPSRLRSDAENGGDEPIEVRDRDIDRIRHWFEVALKVRLSKPNVVAAVRLVADRHAFHPVRDYLAGLTWDGVPRIAEWLERYAAVRPEGAAQAALVRNVAQKWLLSAVARAMEPGCKVDTMLILEGQQGIGKSRALAALAGARFFSDAAIDFGSKDACQTIQGVWILELAELDAILRRDPATVKAFLSRSTDRFRQPYGRTTENVPRGVVFAGTVNHGAYLRDTTGNRRYWIVRCQAPLDVEGLALARDQLWAEAVHLYKGGASWHLDRPSERAMADEADARLEADPWEELLSAWTAARAANTNESSFSMNEVLEGALGLRTSVRNAQVTSRVSRILARLGYERRRRNTAGRGYGYVRVDVSLSHCPTTPPLRRPVEISARAGAPAESATSWGHR